MDDFKKFLEFFESVSLSNISAPFILINCGISFLVVILSAIIDFARTKVFQWIKFLILSIVVILIDFIFLATFQGKLLLFPYLFSPFIAFLAYKKFFSDIEEFKISPKSKKNNEEKEKTPEELEAEQLEKIKEAFNKCINPSIIEILFIYGYISENHKNTLEMNNIFDSPDQMAEKLLTTYVLTEEQLKEARAIMNIIRTSNKVVSKQEALRILSSRKED